MSETEDRANFVIALFFIAIIIATFLVICLGQTSRELRIIKAKCLKVGVATMTYDINTGESKFIFDVGESKDGKENK